MRYMKYLAALIAFGVVSAAIYLWTPAGPKVDESDIRDMARGYDTRIIRDEWGVPHIFGATDPDTAFGLGYAHAEDDWETIQTVLQSSRGMSAQYQGKAVAPADYLFDLFKVDEAVREKVPTHLREETRAMARAYADGLNLYGVDYPDQVLPGILPVTEFDIIAGFTWATPFFYRMDETLKALFEADEQPAVSPWKKETRLINSLPEAVRGSNAFAIAPGRSEDGHTRLVLNSHQPFTGPYAWYEAHMRSETGYHVAGAGFPGTPIITQGVTPHHGWAQTVNRPDLVDVYLLETDQEKNPESYKIDGAWKPFEIGKSKFRVKLFGPFSLPVTRDVLWSDHGPVISTSTGHYAVRFSGLQAVGALEQWYDMGRITSFEDWKTVMNRNDILSFNILYADKTGHIGAIYNARMPKRIEGPDWTETLPGTDSELIWRAFVPHSDLPQIYDPECGWLFSANATPFNITDPACNKVRGHYSATFGIESRITNRSLQALSQFTNDSAISREELLQYRADGRYHPNSILRKFIDDILLMEFEDAYLQEAQNLLRTWDGNTDMENRATALAVLTGMSAKGYEYIEELKDAETALRQSVEDLKAVFGRIDPKWSEANRLIRGDTNLPLNGGPDTLRAIYGDRENFVANQGLKAIAGDTHIMIADWDPEGNLDLVSIHQFGAATIDETSPHFDDQAELFAKGGYKFMPMSLEEVLPSATRDYRPGQ